MKILFKTTTLQNLRWSQQRRVQCSPLRGCFPAVTISFNLAPGTALGDAVTTVERATREIGLPAAIRGSFQGTAQAFQDSLASQPMLIAAALVAVYIVLGVLYESYIHPITSSPRCVSRRWRTARAPALRG